MTNSARPSDPIVLHDSGDLQVLHLPGTSDFTLVTFDIMHAKANGRGAFGIKLARRLGLDFYGVVPTRPHWYPMAETREIARLIGTRKDRPSIGYGASMGGYGVLKFAHELRTDATLAFSPQATIDPATTGRADRRYGVHFDPEANAGMQITDADLGPNAFAICDPGFAPDAYQRSLLPMDVTHIDVPFTGHRAAVSMIPSANALANMRDALAGNAGKLTNRLRRASRSSLQYAKGKTKEALAQGRGDAALTIIDDAIAVHGEERDALVLRARAHKAAGNPSAGIPDLRTILDAQPFLITARKELVDILESIGDTGGAIRELAEAFDISPNPVLATRLHGLLKEQDPGVAKAVADRAITLWPDRAAQFEE